MILPRSTSIVVEWVFVAGSLVVSSAEKGKRWLAREFQGVEVN